MGTRLQLQTLIEGLLGTRNVYFQPPSTLTMAYPCVVYERAAIATKFANNMPYQHLPRYQMTLIDKSPDSTHLQKLLDLPRCTFDRQFAKDNLHHFVFNIYY